MAPDGDPQVIFIKISMASDLVELLGCYSNRTYWIKLAQTLDQNRTRKADVPLRERQIVRRLSEDEVTKLVYGYQAGANVYELAKQFGVHRVTVSERLHSRGVTMRRQSMTEQQTMVAARFYERGWSIARVGRHLGFSGGTVWLALRAHAVPMRDTHGRQ
jgi:lambda repressor-like predicted transcriptional regulator